MNYIVYDTEFNQPQPKFYNINAKFKPNRISPFEIIEIGAVKINENMEIVDTFRRLIEPVIYKRLNPIIVRKTGINKKDLKCGEGFVKVIKDFRSWAGEDFVLCTWSDNDVRELKRNCNYHRVESSWLDNYYDIQKHCTKILGMEKNQAVGLKNALSMLDIEIDKKLHRALEDAIYTAKIFIKVFSEEMKQDIEKTTR